MDRFDDDDDDLKAAIEASLGVGPSKLARPKAGIVDLTADSDGSQSPSSVSKSEAGALRSAELQQAIDLSLEKQNSFLSILNDHDAGSRVLPGDMARSSGDKSSPANAGVAHGILGIDRKKQEEERLARQAKKRKASPPAVVKQTKVRKPEKLHSLNPSQVPSATDSRSKALPSVWPGQPLAYPSGAIMKTWAFQYDRSQDVKIEEVLQKSDLELAVLSSFQWDMDWLFTKFSIAKTKFILVMEAKDEAMVGGFIFLEYLRPKLISEQRSQLLEEAASLRNVRLCFPPMEGQVNCMHSKLMLLFHPSYLRIVVPSANLVPYDWGEEGGFMENV
jgi:hypothetical protein